MSKLLTVNLSTEKDFCQTKLDKVALKRQNKDKLLYCFIVILLGCGFLLRYKNAEPSPKVRHSELLTI